MGAADAASPEKVAEHCERAPALSPHELLNLAVVRPPLGLSIPGCTLRLLSKRGGAQRVLISSLDHADVEVRRRAARLLGLLGRTGAVGALISALPANAADGLPLGAEVIRALGRIGDSGATAALAKLVRPGGVWLPQAAAALGHVGGHEAIAALRDCSTDSCTDEWSNVAGLEQLGSTSPPQAVVARCADVRSCWATTLKEGPAVERRRAARWLAGSPELVGALRDDDEGVRRDAREALLRGCTAECARAAKEALDAPELRPADRLWLRYVLLRHRP
jgi:HEAT repeat protein